MIEMMTKLTERQRRLEEDLQMLKGQYDHVQHEISKVAERQTKDDKARHDIAAQVDSAMQKLDLKWSTEIMEIENVLGTKTDTKKVDEIEKSYAAIVKQGTEEVENFRNKIMQDQEEAKKILEETKSHIQEEKDRDARKNNIIIYRVEENASSSGEDSASYDKQFVRDLFCEVLKMSDNEEDIRKVIRLGKKGDKDRPMLVQLRSVITKNQVMESLKMLKNADERFRRISVTHDMTKREREQCKEMVVQAKEKKNSDNSGEWKFVVRGQPGNMRVVKIKQL